MVQKRRFFFSFLISVIIFLKSIFPGVCLGDSQVNPVTKNGKKWRIAYLEGGPYSDYADSMRAIIEGLMELDWICKSEPPPLQGNVSKPYWEWLVKESKSHFLEFRDEDAYSAKWLDEIRQKNRSAVLEKLKNGKIDLIIAMGTWAGQDLANNQHSVPTTVVSTSNPIMANIIKSAEDSGLDHVTARVDSTRYLRQIRMFHRLTGFNKLGLVFEDTPDGRIYCAMPDIEKVAAERGFDIVTCLINDTQADREASGMECMECIRKLALNSDAVYLTALTTIDEKIEQIAERLKKEGIPSFSMVGSKYVRKGILMSISTDEGYKAQGIYDAEKIAKILNGVKPRDLEQEFPDPLDIAINMETARAIGFEPPGSILRIANEIYDKNSR